MITAGASQAFDYRDSAESQKGYGLCDWILIGFAYIFFFLTLPISCFFSLKIVKEFERAVIFRMGRVSSPKGPGLFFVLPFIDTFKRVDMRTATFDVPSQEVLTKDAVSITVDAVCYLRIHNPVSSLTNVYDAKYSTQLLAAAALRNILGTKTLQEILLDKQVISHTLREVLDEATETWGIKVERVEVKDVSLPFQMQRAMAAEAEASREAKAKVIDAEGEKKASGMLRKAADVMESNPVAIQLRYLQTLSNLSNEKNHCVIVPFPLELARRLAGKYGVNDAAPALGVKKERQIESGGDSSPEQHQKQLNSFNPRPMNK